MKLLSAAIDIFLNPGDVFFGENDMRIRTILGSCVAITVWHPQRKIGGMCHYMLPMRARGRLKPLDGRYADEAVLLLLKEILRQRSNPYDYQVKLFGGGNMFTRAVNAKTRSLNVADRNVIAGQELLQRHGFAVAAEHLGGNGHRQIIFEIGSGDVWLRKYDMKRDANK
jgi:chemotaxis protein CheD